MIRRLKRIRVCEFIYQDDKLIRILDVEGNKKSGFRKSQYFRIDDLFDDSDRNIDGVIISGNLIGVFQPDEEDQFLDLIMEKCYVQEDRNNPGFSAFIKMEKADSLFSGLLEKGHHPVELCLAPLFLTNDSDKYQRKTTSTWEMIYSGPKLVELNVRDFQEAEIKEEAYTYLISVASLISEGNLPLIPFHPGISSNREKVKTRKMILKSVLFFTAILFTIHFLLSWLESNMIKKTDAKEANVKRDLVIKHRRDSLQDELRRIDSIIIRKRNNSKYSIAVRLDQAASCKPEGVIFKSVYYNLPDSAFMAEGYSRNHQLLNSWLGLMNSNNKSQVKIIKLETGQEGKVGFTFGI